MVLSKLLESLVLSRMEPTLVEAGLPHRNQSAYRKHTRCSDASQELIARYVDEGSTVYMCLFDIQKAFDSIEFNVLFDRLFSTGVNGKTWRLIKSWYQNGFCFVQVNGNVSSTFPVERGVRQSSILSPTLFNIVMDPLLKLLESGQV